MHRRLVSLAAASLMAVLLSSAPAEARPFVQAGSVETGLTMGGYFFLVNGADLDNTFDYGVTAAYNYGRYFGAELGFGVAPREVNQVTITNLHMNVVMHAMVHDWAVPFVGIGPTFSTVSPVDGDRDSDTGANVVVGMKLYPWDSVGFRLDARYIARLGTDTDESTEQDLLASAGMFMTFGGAAPKSAVLLDTDGDGFLDPDDACPTVPGVASAKGCPDKDGDTVIDGDDACPDDPGPVALAGCPDTDADTVIDRDDRCPKVPGSPELSGCPDTDSDTLADPDDRCPKIPGEIAYQGCPPPPPKEIIERYSGIMRGITFEFDKAIIRSESFKVLDRAVKAMIDYPHLVLRIDGHTSTEGTPQYNMDLSRQRAQAVKQYMVDRGVDGGRIVAKGYGATRPVAPEDTKAGRERNRRIEFTILRQ